MSGQYTKVIATDYNTIQKKIAAVLGIGGTDPNTNLADNTFGYNQSVLSNQVSVNAKVSSNQWSNLRTDILKSRQHQTGATEILTNPTLDVVITESDRYSYNAMVDLCIANRLIIPPASQATRDTITNAVYSVPWNGTLTHTTTITFADSSTMMYFFNTGGYLDITASRTGGSASVKNSSWSTMLTNIGTIRFGRSSTTRIDTSSNVTTASAVGYTSLNTTDQLLYQKSTENSTYAPNIYNLYARTNITSNQIIYTIQFVDASGQPNAPWGLDENIDGLLYSTIQTYRATGNNVSIYLPSTTNVFSGGNGYSVIPSVYAMNEGGSVTFNITTAGIADGTTLYWTTTGTTSAADYTDSQTSGSVTINSNVGSVIRTLSNDLSLDEGQESFSLQLRTGSISGTIVTTSAPVTVNDTSVETFAISSPDGSINEGGSTTFTITTAGVANGTVLYWTASGTVSSTRFTDGLTSGSTTINSNTATITRSITNDYYIDGSTYFSLDLRTGSTSGTIRATSNTVTVNDISVDTIQAGVGSVNEGGSVTFTVTGPTGMTYAWYTNGNVAAGRFTDGVLSGNVTISSGNTATIVRSLTADYITDGSTYFSLTLRRYALTNPDIATSNIITVNDTYVEIASVTQNRTYIGNNWSGAITTVTFTVSTNNFANGTTLYWQVMTAGGTYQSNTFNDNATSGSFGISGNSGSFSRTWGGGI